MGDVSSLVRVDAGKWVALDCYADLEVEAESRLMSEWEAWRDQRTKGRLPFEMAVSAGRSRERP